MGAAAIHVMKLAISKTRTERGNVNAVFALIDMQRLGKGNLHRLHTGIERVGDTPRQKTYDRRDVQNATKFPFPHSGQQKMCQRVGSDRHCLKHVPLRRPWIVGRRPTKIVSRIIH